MTKPAVGSEAMSYVDSAWLHMDEPNNRMIVTGVIVLDRKLSLEALLEVVETRLLAFDRFRQRVVEASRPLQNTRWEADPDFDLRRHVVRAELPAPGDETALQQFVSELMSRPLDPAHPLWEFQFVEDYEGGSALVCRFHHCIGDGIAMVHVMLSLTDDSLPPEPGAETGDTETAADEDERWESVGREVGRSVGRAVGAAGEFLISPARALEVAGQASATATALAKLALRPSDAATPFKGKLTREKRAVWSRPIELDQVKAIGRRTGATVNDVLLSAASGALRRYLASRGHPVDDADIRAIIPVNLRGAEDAHELGNRFGLVFLTLPLCIGDSLERIFEVRKRMDTLKQTPEAFVALQILKALGMAPRQIFEHVLELFGKKATAVMTNVKGPTAPIYIGGVPIRQVMAWVPRSAGLGLGVSILSYNNRVWLGIATDAGLVPDPETVLDGFYAEFEEMENLVRLVE